MKKIQLIFIAFVLANCSTNEANFTDDIKVIIPDPRLAELAKTKFVDVQVDDETSISGITGEFQFKLSNNFTNYNAIPGGIGYGEILYQNSQHFVMYSQGEIADQTIGSLPSYNIRFTLESWEVTKIGQVYYSGDLDDYEICFITKETGWIAVKYTLDSNGPDKDQLPDGIRIYKVNGNSYDQISFIPGNQYVPVDIYFKNEMEGLILARDFTENTTSYLFKTIDGGINWTPVTTFSNAVRQIILWDSNNICISRQNGYYSVNGYYASGDDGNSWSEANVANVVNTTVAGDGTLLACVYAGTENTDKTEIICSLLRSDDKGKTWTKVNGKLFYADKINFLTGNIGLAYTQEILQYTSDGGLTWRLLAFPYKTD